MRRPTPSKTAPPRKEGRRQVFDYTGGKDDKTAGPD
jgi:hypothetical protein